MPIEELTTSKEDEKSNKTNEQEKGKGLEIPSIKLSEEFVELLFRSCLFSTLNSYLMNDSGNFEGFFLILRESVFNLEEPQF